VKSLFFTLKSRRAIQQAIIARLAVDMRACRGQEVDINFIEQDGDLREKNLLLNIPFALFAVKLKGECTFIILSPIESAKTTGRKTW